MFCTPSTNLHSTKAMEPPDTWLSCGSMDPAPSTGEATDLWRRPKRSTAADLDFNAFYVPVLPLFVPMQKQSIFGNQMLASGLPMQKEAK